MRQTPIHAASGFRPDNSAATLTAYRREVERRLLWAVLQLGKPLPSLTHEDLLIYERFLADPQSAARWVLAGSKRAAPDRLGHLQ